MARLLCISSQQVHVSWSQEGRSVLELCFQHRRRSRHMSCCSRRCRTLQISREYLSHMLLPPASCLLLACHRQTRRVVAKQLSVSCSLHIGIMWDTDRVASQMIAEFMLVQNLQWNFLVKTVRHVHVQSSLLYLLIAGRLRPLGTRHQCLPA